MDAATVITGGASAVFIAIAALVAYRARAGDRLRASAWLFAMAAFMASLEDPTLLIWLASVSGSTDRDGVLGLVHPHIRGHMYGDWIFALAGLGLAVTVAFIPLRRREPWS